MKKILFYLAICCFLPKLFAQEEEVKNEPFFETDSLYVEDQFYIGATYNIMFNRPDNVSQRNLSNGIYAGFIKDLPVNKNRNKAIGIGLGYSVNTYFDEIKITRQGDDVVYEVIDSEISISKNKIITHIVELPIEFRWRTSTPDKYQFWRIYPGFKLGYVFSDIYKFESGAERLRFSNPDLNKLQYGVTISVGYNTWNLNAYYGLNQMFDNASLSDGTAINTRDFKLGLMFYIL
ncbi:porin family protein [Spongiivirga citrea]|uniref:Outer membrane beta-barrel protein n=1 Tax=Spongiivirga citrea TaxID=1481457 RepID=A0A6M0CJP8_9FLAO|nr:porin family protein [Spongiivirga citrea]NER18061.1 outer membrane beta-barrel protein [Spongiivirga citrea]